MFNKKLACLMKCLIKNNCLYYTSKKILLIFLPQLDFNMRTYFRFS